MKSTRDTGAYNRVKKFSKIAFNRGRMVKAGLDVLAERMKVPDPEQNINYKFLECEQA